MESFHKWLSGFRRPVTLNVLSQRDDTMQHKRTNGLSIVVAFVVFASLAFLNADGYQLHLAAHLGTPPVWYGPGNFVGEPPHNNWLHGWPLAFAKRHCYDRTQGIDTVTSRWPLDGTPFDYFNPSVVALDCVIAILLVYGAFRGSKLLFTRRGLDLRFSISSLLALTLASAVAITLGSWLFATRYTMQVIAILGVVVGLAFCALCIWGAAANQFKRRNIHPDTT